MKFGFSVLVLIISLFNHMKYASSILCYDCNSAFDPRCGEEFDSFSLGVVNCSLKDPLEHIPEVESTLCRSIKMEFLGKVRVVRQCGYLTDEPSENPCRRQSGTGDLFVTYCSCNTDLCNSAHTHHLHYVALGLVMFSFTQALMYYD